MQIHMSDLTILFQRSHRQTRGKNICGCGWVKSVVKTFAWLSEHLKITVLGDFAGYGQPLWPHTGQVQGQPVHLVSTP